MSAADPAEATTQGQLPHQRVHALLPFGPFPATKPAIMTLCPKRLGHIHARGDGEKKMI